MKFIFSLKILSNKWNRCTIKWSIIIISILIFIIVFQNNLFFKLIIVTFEDLLSTF